jgi:penicillin-binding protein 1A
MTQRGRRRQRRRGSVGTKVAIAIGVVLAVIAIGVIGVTNWVLNVAADAPSLASCKRAERHGNSVIYAANGERLGAIVSPEASAPVARRKIPRKLELATVAIEDQRFFQHGGLDTQGILRAAVTDIEAGEAVEGGSTITQQLVRNLCIQHPKKTLERKIEEAKLALEYSEHHTKGQILGQYLNTATYGTVEGSTAVGVGAASRFYFGRPVWKLDTAQMAMLAVFASPLSRLAPLE